MDCACGTGRDYNDCCGVIHQFAIGLGVSAEQVMRARYAAYVMHNEDFLLNSWHPKTRPDSIDFGEDTEWQGLQVVETTAGLGFDTEGTVEFKAWFRHQDENFLLHELSQFVRVDGRWFYVDGDQPGLAD